MNLRLATLTMLLAGFAACKEVPPPIDPIDPEPVSPYEFLLQGPIDSLRSDAGIPGLAAGIVEGENLTYEGYFGVTSLTNGTSVDRETRFTAGPVSAMVTTMAVLQLANEGKVDLDAHINEYLDWDVLHPVYPQATISLRMLLSHVSSIKDDSVLLASFVTAGDPTPNFEIFLRNYLEKSGSLYVPTRFDSDRPGKVYRYSSVAIALAAHVVESVEGIPFSVWCETNLFAGLGFASDGWFLDNLGGVNVAVPHRKIGSAVVPQLLYSYPMYPAGLLRTNLRATSRMWRALMQKGAFGDQRFYGEAENQMLTKVQYPYTNAQQALGWKRDTLGVTPVWVSGGEDLGFTSFSYFDPAKNAGVILFANAAGFSDDLELLATIMLNAIQ